MSFVTSAFGRKAFEQGLHMVAANPQKNLRTVVNWVAHAAPDPQHRAWAANVNRLLSDPESGASQLAERLLTRTAPNVRDRMAVNFLFNAGLEGVHRQRKAAKEHGVGVPWAILMDPTERCNLRCTGCWAGDYQRSRELSLETMDRICTEGHELGIEFYVLSGGEPTVRMNDIFTLAERHPDQTFHLFTNGTLLTEAMGRRMVELGNVTLAFSVEGLEAETDARRGKGVFQKLTHNMEMLRDLGLVFGFSACYTRKNTEVLGSDEFIDTMIEKGATFGWYFTYIPIGRDVDLELMASPEQRAWMYDRIQLLRRTKPVFLMDFWNDGEIAQGCIAGGRRYFHINAAGEVEPCAFVHYATCNINNVSLVEALGNPLFRAYQSRQPFDKNYRRPCPLIDHPEMMQAMVHESGAHATQLHADETVDEFAEKLKGYAAAWGEKADAIWRERHPEYQAHHVG